MAPEAGLEPATSSLTGTRATIAPLWNEAGRNGEIRTRDFLHPKQALYRAELRSESPAGIPSRHRWLLYFRRGSTWEPSGVLFLWQSGGAYELRSHDLPADNGLLYRTELTHQSVYSYFELRLR